MPASLGACKTTYNLEEYFKFLYTEPVETNKQIGVQSKLYVFVDNLFYCPKRAIRFDPFL